MHRCEGLSNYHMLAKLRDVVLHGNSWKGAVLRRFPGQLSDFRTSYMSNGAIIVIIVIGVIVRIIVIAARAGLILIFDTGRKVEP